MEKIFTLAEEHAQQFEANHQAVVVPVGNTPLSELVAAYDTSLESYEATLTGIADFLADKMAVTMDFTRNTVKPAIEKIIDAVNEGLKDIKHDPFDGMTIEEVGYPEVLEEPEFVMMLDSFAGGFVPEPKVFPKYGPKSDAEIMELISTGNGAWDKSIKDWLAKQPEDTLQTVWKVFFQERGSAQVQYTVDQVLKDFNNGGFSCLLVFLIAYRIKAAGVPDEFGMKLDDARTWLYDMCRLAASNIKIGIQRYNNLAVAGQVVISTNQMDRKVRVNKAMYKQYLASGGKADVLMGLLISNARITSIRELQERSEELLKAWHLYIRSREAEALNTFERQARAVIASVFEAELNTPINEQEADMITQVGVRQEALKIFKQELDQLPKSAFAGNLQDALWKVIVKSRFHYNTTAYQILDLVDYHVGQGMDPKDASTVAYESVICQFVGEMMKTTKN